MNISNATFSPCNLYRYMLFRDLGMQGPQLTAVMLNPSTADATKDDPTIRRLIGFAKSWGMGPQGRSVSAHLHNAAATRQSGNAANRALRKPFRHPLHGMG